MADPAQEILAADRAFAALSVAQGAPAAFGAYAAPSAVVYRPGRDPIEGADELARVMATDPEATLQWTPQAVTVAASGELGFTRGTFEYRPAIGSGARGSYVSIWQRDEGGAWKFIFDSGIVAGPLPDADATVADGSV